MSQTPSTPQSSAPDEQAEKDAATATAYEEMLSSWNQEESEQWVKEQRRLLWLLRALSPTTAVDLSMGIHFSRTSAQHYGMLAIHAIKKKVDEGTVPKEQLHGAAIAVASMLASLTLIDEAFDKDSAGGFTAVMSEIRNGGDPKEVFDRVLKEKKKEAHGH